MNHSLTARCKRLDADPCKPKSQASRWAIYTDKRELCRRCRATCCQRTTIHLSSLQELGAVIHYFAIGRGETSPSNELVFARVRERGGGLRELGRCGVFRRAASTAPILPTS